MCLIARNEEKNLPLCLTPVAPLVDEIVVVDTGSTDNTRAVAADLGARVVEFRWREDFAAARNEALDRATGDWIFWLDADDRLDAVNVRRLTELLAGLPERPQAYMMNCLSVPPVGSDEVLVLPHCRLFRRHPAIRWERRVHEQILPSLERVGHRIVGSDVQIQHVGYQDPTLQHRKANRDLRLLRLEYTFDPTDPQTLFHLGLAYLRLGQDAEALTYLLSSLKYAVTAGNWLRRLYSSLCETLVRLGRHADALALSAQGLAKFPNDPVLLTRRAELLTWRRDLGGAERCLLQLLRSPEEVGHLTGDQAVLNGSAGRYLLGLVYQDQGRGTDAERVFQELLARHPAHVKGWIGLGYIYLAQRRFGNVEHVAQQIEKCDQGGVYAAVLRAEAHIAREEFPVARVLLDQAITQAPKLVWPRFVLGDWLMKSGADLAACIAAQRDILRLAPGYAPTVENLERLLRQQRGEREPNPLWFTVTV